MNQLHIFQGDELQAFVEKITKVAFKKAKEELKNNVELPEPISSVCELLKISKDTLIEWERDRFIQLKIYRMRRKLFVKQSDVLEAMERSNPDLKRL